MKRSSTKPAKPEKAAPAASVDEYLAALPREQRVLLEKLRQAIRSAAPQAEEVISYRIPTYKYHGALVHFLAHRDYCSFVVVDKALPARFADELEGYDISGTTIHFTEENPLPAPLVKKIVKARLKDNEGRGR